MIIPARRLFYVVGFNAALGLVTSFHPDALALWYGVAGFSLLLSLIDAINVLREPDIEVQRCVPHSLPLGIKRVIRLHLVNRGKRRLHLQLFDHYPLEVAATGFPLALSLNPQQFVDAHYEITAIERGKLIFPTLQVRMLSPQKLWWHNRKLALLSEVKVYPNFAAVAQYALLAVDNHLSHLGIMKKRRRGEGQDFHQLREYRQGDSLRQIDWKASARMRKPISREYQDERDQEIIFMLDCGHRMLAKDDALSHFDHTLNAILLVTYVALKQGDAVGLGTFAGTSRWLPAHKGMHNVQHMLNTLYDIQPTTQAPDYAQAATELLVRQKKRSLVILLTNLRDEDLDDLLPAVHLLRKRHLVLLASMREQAIDNALEQPLDTSEDVLKRAALEHYIKQRERSLERIRAAGIRCLDVSPPHLSVQLINQYLDIKRSGLL
jgi:uncharacterized protein (DUF58 family)